VTCPRRSTPRLVARVDEEREAAEAACARLRERREAVRQLVSLGDAEAMLLRQLGDAREAVANESSPAGDKRTVRCDRPLTNRRLPPAGDNRTVGCEPRDTSDRSFDVIKQCRAILLRMLSFMLSRVERARRVPAGGYWLDPCPNEATWDVSGGARFPTLKRQPLAGENYSAITVSV
jgi:hypothetical protein